MECFEEYSMNEANWFLASYRASVNLMFWADRENSDTICFPNVPLAVNKSGGAYVSLKMERYKM